MPVALACQEAPDSSSSVEGAGGALGRSWILGAVAFGGVALIPLDEPIRDWIQAGARQESSTLRTGARWITPLGSAGPLLASTVIYGIGRAIGEEELASAGLHTAEGIAGTAVVVTVMKGLIRRRRPFVMPHNSRAFFEGSIMKSDSTHESFPSGHTALAFALAAAASEEMYLHWPRKRVVVGRLLYGAATAVGVARMYDDRHWASDVVVGAAVGTFVSRTVVRWANASKPGSVLGSISGVAFFPGVPPTVAFRVTTQ
ncbi:MAG: phosphatase PAP2 family protein [Gemmatimonadetes bacterium]|nr:phosphatase PAP2 family protein [Gemmatimonadota bacterium]